GRIFKQADGKFYEPSFGSMDCYLVLCSFVWFYGLLSRSMFLRLVLWTFISLYEPSSCSMDPHPVLCSICLLHQLVHLFISLFLTPTTPEKSIDQVLFSNNAHHLILLFLF